MHVQHTLSARVENSRLARRKQQFIGISPIFVVLVSTLVIRVAARFLDTWAWVPWIVVYWALIGGLAIRGGGREAIRRWMGAPAGHWLWSALAMLFGLSGLTMFVTSWQLITPLYILIPWLIVGLVNPFLEEWYWRGLMLDHTRQWTNWLRIFYISAFFSLNHLLGIGVTSIAGHHPVLLINTFVVSVVFSIVYLRTNSLRYLILSHALLDLFGLSVPVFLNLWVPPG